jgi:hypothetical protein
MFVINNNIVTCGIQYIYIVLITNDLAFLQAYAIGLLCKLENPSQLTPLKFIQTIRALATNKEIITKLDFVVQYISGEYSAQYKNIDDILPKISMKDEKKAGR